jgi:hypothetical protein
MQLAWHETGDVIRGVLAKLQSNSDLLNCDLVCKRWRDLQQSLPQAANITVNQAAQKPWLSWLTRNAHRLSNLTLSGCTDNQTCSRQMWLLLREAQGLQKLQLQHYTSLVSLPPAVVDVTSLRELVIGSSRSNSSSSSCCGSDSDGSSSADSNQASSSSSRPQHQQLCGLQELPESIGELKQLQRLELQRCSALRSVPDSISGCSALTTVSS